MNLLRTGLRKALTAVAGLLHRRPFHRDVAIVGVAAHASEELVRRLMAAERGRAHVLLPSSAPIESANGVRGVGALYLAEGRRKRRRWRFGIAADAGSPGDACGGSDTVIVCVSHEEILADGELVEAADARITGAVGHARDGGRLRRAAIALLGCPAACGPFDSSQVVNVFRHGDSLAEAIDETLRRGAACAGDAAADPVWRRFLTTVVAANARLSGLFETLREATGQAPPLFLVPASDRPVDAALPILAWIDGGRVDAIGGGRSRARVWIAATSLAALFLVGVGFVLQAARVPDLNADSASLQRTIAIVEDRLAPYAWARWLMPGRSRGEQPLRRELDVLKSLAAATSTGEEHQRLDELERALREEAEQKREDLDAQVARIASEIQDATAEGRFGASRKLAELAAAATTELDAWRSSRIVPGIDSEVVRPWRDAIARTFVASIFAGLAFGDGGWGALLVPEGARATVGQLSAAGYRDEAACLTALLETRTPASFLSGFARAAEGSPLLADVPEVGIFLPRPDVAAAVESLAACPESVVLADPASVATKLSEVVSVAEIVLPGGALVDASAAARGRELLAALAVVASRREMVVRFSRVYDAGWHVDVLVDGGPGVVPAQWLPGRGDDGCLVRIDLAPGESLAIRLNPDVAVHVLPGEKPGACVRGGTEKVRLQSRSGEFEINGKRITYEVVEGWPTWPPTTST